MLRRCWIVSLLPVILLGVGACQPAETEPAATAPTESTEADLAALRELVRNYDDYANSDDLGSLVALFADDAVRMPPDQPAIQGREAIRSQSEAFSAENTGELSSTVEDVRVSGDWGFVRISYTESSTPRAGGETTTTVGKWILICERQADGSWQITNEMWSTYEP